MSEGGERIESKFPQGRLDPRGQTSTNHLQNSAGRVRGIEPVVQIDGVEVLDEHLFRGVTFCGFEESHTVQVALCW